MFTKDIGIDLGTANTLVYMKGRGIIMREPSVVAVDPRSDELRVRSVGHEAKAVIGRAPGSIVAVRCFAGWIPSSRMRRASRSTLPKAPWTV